MSAFPPPIPQKIKTKSLNLSNNWIIEDSAIKRTSNVNSLDISILDQDNSCLIINNENPYCFNQLNDYCLELKAEDQRLLQLLMCIREEILILKETGVVNQLNAGGSKSYHQLLHTMSEGNIRKITSHQEIESILTSYLDIDESINQNSVEINIFSHFDIPALFNIVDDFMINYDLSTFSNRNFNSDILNRVDDTAICDSDLGIFSKDDTQLSHPFIHPPPVPEKALKRLITSNSTLPTDSHCINNASSTNQTLLCDPVLDKCWPRSKSFNSDAFLSHTRQSSMTLSDFYDHLHPLSTLGNIKSDSNDQLPKPLNKLPISKSNMDCKLSSLDTSPSFRHDIHKRFSDLKIIKNSSDGIDHSKCSDIDTEDCILIRAGSTPSLCSNSILPMTTSVADDFCDSTRFLQDIQSLHPNISSIPSTKSKTPKRFFSIISRGFSSGFNRHNDKKSPIQKYSQSSGELYTTCSDSCIDANRNEINSLAQCNSPKANLLIPPILSPLIEHPPPIPPKFNKPNADTAINLQQTWC